MTLPLIPIGAALVPEVLRLLGRDPSGLVAAAVDEAVRQAAGTPDPATARAALDGDPARAAALRLRLAEMALRSLHAPSPGGDPDGTEPAGTGTAFTADPHGDGTRGALAVSGLVVVGFFSVLALLVSLDTGPGGAARFDPQVGSVINVTVGTLGAAFAAVVNFWIGSSQSSRSKDAIVRRMQEVHLQAKGANPAQPDAAPRPPAAANGPPAAPLTLVSLPPRPSAEDRFDACLDQVLSAEGGFVNNPSDPGGATNLGITRRALAEFREAEVTEDDVRALTRAEAREIYRSRFWTPMRCADLPPGVDLMVFDFGVNAGPGRSLRLLQGTAGVRADGSAGPVTLAAVRACRAPDLIARLAEGRLSYYRGLESFPILGRGWTRRVDATRQTALAMAATPRPGEAMAA